MNAPAQMVVFAMPKDPSLLAVWGAVSIRYAQLDHVLRLMIMTVSGEQLRAALDKRARWGSESLRGEILTQARKRLGDCKTIDDLENILAHCRSLTELRNRLIHDVVVTNVDGEEPHMQNDKHGRVQLPNTKELIELADALGKIASALNYARRSGFLHEALSGSVP